MAGPAGINNDQLKQQAQYLNMRGAQMAMENAGQTQSLDHEKAKGSKKQLIGTVVGVVLVVAVLFLLAHFRVI